MIKPTQSLHQQTRIFQIKKPGGYHDLFEMPKKSFQLLTGSGGFLDISLPGLGLIFDCFEYFITQHLDRRGDIERAEIWVGRDIDCVVTDPQLIVG